MPSFKHVNGTSEEEVPDVAVTVEYITSVPAHLRSQYIYCSGLFAAGAAVNECKVLMTQVNTHESE